MELLWRERTEEGPRRGPKRALSLDQIARVAIEVADAEGLEALTMQRLAAALGFTKMALYRYVPGKDELVALMAEVGIGAPPSLPDGEWRMRLHQWARVLFERFTRHPWALRATVGSRPVGPNEMAWLESAVAMLAGTGLDGAEQLDVVVTLVGHIRAIAEQLAAMGERPEQHVNASLAALVEGRQDRFPALAEALKSVAVTPDAQNNALDFGLAHILDGVELLVSSR